MVRVLDEDPGLGRHLSARAFALARSAAIAPLLSVEEGTISFLLEEPATHGHLGLLVLDGLIARHVLFGQLGSTEFLGPGDVVRPWVMPSHSAKAIRLRGDPRPHPAGGA